MALILSVLAPMSVRAATTPPDAWASEYGDGASTAYNGGESTVTATRLAGVAQAWRTQLATGQLVAPVIVGGVVYHVVNSSPDAASAFTATSARTGATLWTVRLPVGNTYLRGQAVVGSIAIAPYEGWHKAAGISAVDLRTHKVLYSRSQPAPQPAVPGLDASTAGPISIDSTRVYMYAGSNPVNVFRLSDGTPLWHLPTSSPYVRGIAISNGVLYTGSDSGVVAYSAVTGARLWAAPGYGPPIVAGGRVFSSDSQRIYASSASGCGASRCAALWTRTVGGTLSSWISLGGADGSTLYASYTLDGPSGRTGRIQRISASTGSVQWTGSPGVYPGAPVRAGNTVWTVDDGTRLEAFSTTQTSAVPLKVITEDAGQSVTQGTAIAAGSVVVQVWPSTLLAYRVSGS